MKILVGIDLSDSTEKVVKKAMELAKSLTARVWLLHVTEPDPDFVGFEAGPQSVRDSLSRKFHIKHRQIQEIADRLRMSGLDATALLVQGDIAETILEEGLKLGVNAPCDYRLTGGCYEPQVLFDT